MSNWIRLHDHMPESEVDVLVTDGFLVAVAWFDHDEIFPANIASYDDTWFTFTPTHWQPLPSTEL